MNTTRAAVADGADGEGVEMLACGPVLYWRTGIHARHVGRVSVEPRGVAGCSADTCYNRGRNVSASGISSTTEEVLLNWRTTNVPCIHVCVAQCFSITPDLVGYVIFHYFDGRFGWVMWLFKRGAS